ncbi:ATP-binding cassette domain-containing protein, partial [Methylobacterium sp. E-005]|uniref:ATP-binding cassette domain-containing protein n=1 Tax=Methylobacterium sp. E-005 TaxID=2836549 RepID=UPI001FBBB717
FTVARGETLSLVGESGCGKSETSMSILRLLPEPPARIAGAIKFDGKNLPHLPNSDMRKIRGSDSRAIFTALITSLNPIRQMGTHADGTPSPVTGLRRSVRA